ncbi:MAG: hypothetical protein E7Z97_04060 [Propionibacteriaceae bacterium]|jgi:hypothetical protein|uniref:Uncharacterized protein n=1 Tax=Propionibacterium ruminifibrarum TaxID=1962131 RepID=A0A375I1R1_9ACTN|nr:hypothetical protein [Propionibacterium ruminifibrarum]MBE6477234.1 hypothetical protein [Propionibacteriaceae bacterium]SPF67588.1 hypothetical protein PROPJV5_0545 [Propionibacterium ruminifibrarum]
MAEIRRTGHDSHRGDRPGGGRRRGLGRDGITVMVNHDRALRAREISRPGETIRTRAAGELPALLARATGRRGSGR